MKNLRFLRKNLRFKDFIIHKKIIENNIFNSKTLFMNNLRTILVVFLFRYPKRVKS